MAATGDWARLGKYARARREDLGLYREDIAARGGPGVSTLGKIENNRQASYAMDVLAKLDRALGWTAGSARAILDGGEPQLAVAAAPPVDTGAPSGPMLTLASVAATAAVDWVGQVKAEIEEYGRPLLPPPSEENEIDRIIRRAWDTLDEAGVDRAELAEMVAWWRMRTAAGTQTPAVPAHRREHLKSA